jgi:hypothetical protein
VGALGVLTTWVEMEPDETDEAEATMREAAQAFLPIGEDDAEALLRSAALRRAGWVLRASRATSQKSSVQ